MNFSGSGSIDASGIADRLYEELHSVEEVMLATSGARREAVWDLDRQLPTKHSTRQGGDSPTCNPALRSWATTSRFSSSFDGSKGPGSKT